MKIVSRRAMGFGDAGTPVVDDTQLNVRLQPGTAAAGLGLWVAAGVLTHVIVRMLDRWFFNDR